MERTLRFWWNLRSMTVVWCPIFHKKIIGLTQWGGRHPPFCVFFVPLKIVDRQPIPILVRIEFCKKFLKFQLIWLGFSGVLFSFFFSEYLKKTFVFCYVFQKKNSKKKKNEKSAPENRNHISSSFQNFLQNSIRTKIGIL